MKKLITISLLFFIFVPISHAISPQDLVYMTEEYAPYNYTEKGMLKGISIEILRLMWKQMNCPEQKIKVYPWARGYHIIQKEKNHVLFAMSRSKEREIMFKWVGPMYTARFILIGLMGRNIKINTIADVNKFNIGSIREDVAEQLLKTRGVKSIESVSEMETNIKKLFKGRIDLIAHSEKGFDKYCNSVNLNTNQFKTYFIIKETGIYFAFNIHTPDPLIQRFQKAFNKIESSGKLDVILKKYMD